MDWKCWLLIVFAIFFLWYAFNEALTKSVENRCNAGDSRACAALQEAKNQNGNWPVRFW